MIALLRHDLTDSRIDRVELPFFESPPPVIIGQDDAHFIVNSPLRDDDTVDYREVFVWRVVHPGGGFKS